MKKFLCLTVLLQVCLSGHSQNLVVNPDFELFSQCPTANGDLQFANNWLDVVYSSDYVNCAYVGWCPQAVVGAQSGLGYAGFASYGNTNGASEAFGQFLSSPLIAGHNYKLDFYAKKTTGGSYSSICSGLCFYGFSGNPVSGGAQTNICASSLPGAFLLGCSDTISDVLWQPYTITFTAPVALDFLVITPGCVVNCGEYVYIDNIHLVENINFANVCLGDTTVFMMNDTTSMQSASWSFSDPASGANNTSSLFNPSHVFTSTGTFIVRVIRTYLNASMDTVILPVTIYAPPSVNLGNDTTICQGDNVILNAAGPGITGFLWQDGTTASGITADTTGTYIVVVSNPGCSATDTFNLNVIPCSSVLAIFQTVDSLICPGTCTDFQNLSQNATSYQWFFPGANPSVSTDINPSSICYTSPGSYDVELIASDGTTNDTLFFAGYITVYPYPPPQGIQQVGDSLIANQGSVSYQWYFNGTVIPGATDYFYVAPQSGDYNVVCTDANGCEVEAVIFNVVASISSESISTPIQILPNPAKDEVAVRSGIPIDEIRIFNSLGANLAKPVAGLKETKIDIGSLASGIYFLEVFSGIKVYRYKLIRQP